MASPCTRFSVIKEKITRKTVNRYPSMIQKIDGRDSQFGSIYVHVDFDTEGRANNVAFSWKKDGSVIDELLGILGDTVTEMIRQFHADLKLAEAE